MASMTTAFRGRRCRTLCCRSRRISHSGSRNVALTTEPTYWHRCWHVNGDMTSQACDHIARGLRSESLHHKDVHHDEATCEDLPHDEAATPASPPSGPPSA